MVLRRAFRFFLPRRRDLLMDAPLERTANDARFAAIYRAHVGESDPFTLARFDEGLRWRHVMQELAARLGGRFLDLGAGNGAVELAFASAGHLIFGVDALWNEDARLLHRAAGIPPRRVVASADALPFRDAAFAHVVCLETIEHLANARAAGAEMLRVLEADGEVLVTTPPRLRYLVRRDPHFGIAGLLLLPARLQARVAARRGFGGAHHFVDRIYWTVGQIACLFPGAAVERVLSRSRLPARLFWDAVVIRKRRR